MSSTPREKIFVRVDEDHFAKLFEFSRKGLALFSKFPWLILADEDYLHSAKSYVATDNHPNIRRALQFMENSTKHSAGDLHTFYNLTYPTSGS